MLALTEADCGIFFINMSFPIPPGPGHVTQEGMYGNIVCRVYEYTVTIIACIVL